MRSLTLSIVIVNWNTRELLAQCLRSIEASVPPSLWEELEIFVVDNNSSDGSVAMVKQNFDYVHLLKQERNVGFASANNLAIHQSKGRYVLLLNPDTWVYPGALDAMVDFMENCPNIGAVGPWLLEADGQLQPSCYKTPTLARELWRLMHLGRLLPVAEYQMERWSLTDARAVDGITGACLMVRWSVLEQIGLLDEDYFIYTEEVDLCYRIQRAGWPIYWLPSSQVVHYGGQSTRQVAAEMFLRLYESKLLFFRKHHGRTAAFLYKVILFMAGAMRLILGPPAWLLQPSQRQRQQLLVSYYRRLLTALPDL